MIKDKIDKYDLLDSLGMGGFGNVYKAVSCSRNIVALKTLNPLLLDNPEAVNQFIHEAKILSKLNHPNICKLIDFFIDGPVYTIIMEYIDGVDLNELILHEPNNRLPFKQSACIANQCLSAFQYAYERGVLHRDIKPSNIMIEKNGKSIITDFGVAAFIDDVSHDMEKKMMSAAYSPPERFCCSETVDIRSDIYSMGMVFYELFSGRKPFYTINLSEVELWHKNEMPEPVNRINPSLSLKITAAINTALEKKQENRFKDFLEFKDAMGLEDLYEI